MRAVWTPSGIMPAGDRASACPLPPYSFKNVALNQLQLSAEVQQKIYLTNAQKLLKLKIA
jgi:hypothetical protein